MSEKGVIRTPSDDMRHKPIGEDGSTVDYWLTEKTDEEQRIERMHEMQSKFFKKNNLILCESLDPVKDVKLLADPNAFMIEANADLVDVKEKLPEIFKRYVNTLELENLEYTVQTHKNGVMFDETITFKFKRNYSGKKLVMQLQLKNFKDEVKESLKKQCHNWMLENKDSELDF